MIYRFKDLITDKISGEWGTEGSSETGVRVIRTANFTNEGKINYEKLVYRQIDQRKIEAKKLQRGDIIIEKSGGSPTQPVGRVVFFNLDTEEPFLCNNFTTCLRPNHTIVYPQYLFYRFLESYRAHKTIRHQNKTTGIINLKLDNYLNDKIDIPDRIDDQIRIVTVLSKAEALIAQRKESLSLLDELLKSTFLEMFGDESKLENKKYKVEDLKLNEPGTLSNGPFGSDLLTSELRDQGVPVIYIRDIRNGYFEWKSEVYVTQQKADTLPNCKVKEDDVLIAKVGDPPGIAAVYPKGLNEAIITQDVIRLRLNTDIALPQYMQFYLNSAIGKHKIKKISIEGTRNRFPLGDLKKVAIFVPGIDLQIRFAQIVDKVDSLKAHCQASLNELENLYGSLSQRAFKGELDLSRLSVEVPEEIAGVEREKKSGEKVIEQVNKEIEHFHQSLQYSGAPTDIDNTIRQLDTELQIHGVISFWPEYVKYRILKDKLNGRFSYTELSDELYAFPFEKKPTSKDIQEFILKLLEGQPPFIEQIFDIPSSEKNKPVREQQKQIMFRIMSEN